MSWQHYSKIMIPTEIVLHTKRPTQEGTVHLQNFDLVFFLFFFCFARHRDITYLLLLLS